MGEVLVALLLLVVVFAVVRFEVRWRRRPRRTPLWRQANVRRVNAENERNAFGRIGRELEAEADEARP